MSGNRVCRHSMDGTELGTVSDTTTTQVHDLSIFYDPVPEPATVAGLGLGIAAMLRRRRNR